MCKILVLEDNADAAEMIKERLELADFDVDCFETPEDAIEAATENHYDLMVLDVELGPNARMDGIEAASVIKKNKPESKFIFLTAIDQSFRGYTAGALSYNMKPVVYADLAIQIKNLVNIHRVNDAVIEYKGMRFDTARNIVHMPDGQKREMGQKPMELLIYLIKNKGRVVSKEELFTSIWSEHHHDGDNIINTTVNRARRQLGANIIKTVMKKGYEVLP